ncbi:phosphoenolpyruvate--protein phosphotransferase [Anaerocolumna xylanovorans]|uniref:Phosphoenolpyruvate-protein phosphotransferase n=1 Tax=Anaerocolumna xylanovorans DSM 12503 TaxID=1121345 RepID=A0A1M7XY85_9FIRM|nr:phosphoenolpyruvate--protein phosphotransferase [Anaerocolumna xylanovorans]SHO43943.1 phosphotransferase system, enzyme I, PtsI [Anaerocolumna xylanovorans DSM 12503]
MNTIKGLPVSSGIAVGKVFLKKTISEKISLVKVKDQESEKERFQTARVKAIRQLNEICSDMLHTKGEQEASIFSAHMEMLKDFEFINRVAGVIEEQKCNAEWAVKNIRDELVEIFESMDDEYMRERAMDMKDISNRVIRILKGDESDGTLRLAEPAIIAANDLAPSDTAQMNTELVLGILNENGGPTSHAAIIARMLGIPFVVHPQITSLTANGQLLAFDGETGCIELELDSEILFQYQKKQEAFIEKKRQLEKLKGTKSITGDGYEIVLAGNIGASKDVDRVLQQDGHSIGLFRTEFLYMNRTEAPTEEEQFIAYKETSEKMQGNPVIIRTLDIGGDKEVDYLNIPKEENPFLGYRAIRLCLDRIAFWKVQIRALLRASAYGNIHIMFPMIVSLDELRQAKCLIEEVKDELRNEKIAFNESIPVGMMMETPAAALMADVFAKEVDFFSIGTNDLIQYTMAVDRMNGKVSHLYSPYDPAVLRFIKRITDCARENGIWAGICGEAAAEKALIPLWVGIGVKELSMSPVSILQIREKIQSLSKMDCEKLAEKIFTMSTAREIEDALKNTNKPVSNRRIP